MKAAEVSAKQISSKVSLKKRFRQNWDCYLYMAPYMLIFFTFTVLPVVMSIVLSFTYYNILEPPQFIFLDNYRNLLATDDVFLLAVKNTLIIAVIVGPVGYLACLLFAWLINELSPIVRAVMVVILYAPTLSGGAYTIWQVLFSGDSTAWINGMLLNFGLIDEPIQFLTNADYMIWICIIVQIWMSLGAGFLSNVAGFGRWTARSMKQVT